MKKVLLLICFIGVAIAWEGYDYESGNYVEIGKGNLVRKGKMIEIYDYKDGKYKEVEVQSIKRHGNKVEVEVYDYNNNKYRTLNMDGK